MKDKTFEISLQKHIQKMTTDFQQDGEFSPTATGRADRSELVAANFIIGMVIRTLFARVTYETLR